MRKLILIALGFCFTGGSVASCDFLGKNKKEEKKEERKCSPSSKTCQKLSYSPKYERRW